ncbi:MAG: sodium-dependent transporter [Proteobacteria bacterium]|nr:MAG: sodium-dependent transporter [Pseudomonadota bacterium]
MPCPVSRGRYCTAYERSNGELSLRMSNKYDPLSATIIRSSTFFLVATGTVIGFSNIWKFPSLMLENGGLLFLLAYIGCLLLLSVPLLCLELGLGRIARCNPVSAVVLLASKSNASHSWQVFAWFGMLAGLIVLAFYAVIGGMGLSYVFSTAFGFFNDLSRSEVRGWLGQLQQDPASLMAWHSLFILMVVTIVARGVRDGLGRAARLLVPILFFSLYVFMLKDYVSGNLPAAVELLFRIEPEHFSWSSFFEALSHAFFSFGFGLAVMFVLGSYMPEKMSIGKTALGIVTADTVFAVAAGVVLIPLVSSHDDLPQYGFGLVFETLPWVFGHMSFGQFWGAAFFVVLALAGWSSAVALAEPSVSWLIEFFRLTRRTAVMLLLIVVWGLATCLVYSFSAWQDLRFAGLSVFGLLDFLSSRFLIPTGGLLMVLFAGRRLNAGLLQQRLGFRYSWLFSLIYGYLRWVAPFALLVIFLFGLQKLTVSTCMNRVEQDLLFCSMLDLRGLVES